jgi:hypothetical protein
MEYTRLVRGCEPACDLEREVHHFRHWEPAVRGIQVEVASVHELHRDEEHGSHAGVRVGRTEQVRGLGDGLAAVMTGGDIRMLQPCQRPCFVAQSLPVFRVIGVLGRDHLDRTHDIQTRVARAEHDSHSAGTDPLEELVVADPPQRHATPVLPRLTVRGMGLIMRAPRAQASSPKWHAGACATLA